MANINHLHTLIQQQFGNLVTHSVIALDEITIEVKPENLLEVAAKLRDEAVFSFKQLIDVCGVDYLQYGFDDWETESATFEGFSRGVTRLHPADNIACHAGEGPHREAEGTASIDAPHCNKTPATDTPRPQAVARFAVVYHFLSLDHNHRLRMKVRIPNHQDLIVDSVMPLWPSANWFEREVFDLFGILFRGHPDLRRILTDYGFVGHPFRKDFPLIGKVEARYDAKLKRVVYDPVSIDPRILEPKVIRHDNRYLCDNTITGKTLT